MPTGSSLGLLTNVGAGFGDTGRDGAIDRTARVGYMQQWNFGLQRELPGRIGVEAAYAGSKGTKLPDGPLGHQVNQLPAEYQQFGTALQQLVPNPFYNIITTRGPLSQQTVTRGQLLRPYPQFLNVLNFRPASASSTYHSLQIRAQKQFASGLSFLVAYTNAKLISDSDQVVNWLGPVAGAMDVYNRRLERSLSAMDISQRFVASFVYELPFGQGKRFGNDWPAALRWIAGNWQMNGIVTLSRGTPLVVTAPNNTQVFSQGQRPNVAGDPKLDGSRSTTEKLAAWFDTRAFTQPAAFTFGNGPRTLPNVRADGIRNIDYSLFKQFPWGERRRVEFRAEFFNLFNTPNLNQVGRILNSPTFGQALNQLDPRQIQFGLKMQF
jgi:hypothetical protein